MTYGEYMKGVVQGEKNILFVNMAWGLGLGIIIDGNLYYGKSGFSGELGHFCMFENEAMPLRQERLSETEASRTLSTASRWNVTEGSNNFILPKLTARGNLTGDLSKR